MGKSALMESGCKKVAGTIEMIHTVKKALWKERDIELKVIEKFDYELPVLLNKL